VSTLHDWENPAVQGRNRMPMHVDVIPYADLAAALAGDRDRSPYRRTLNGRWRFQLLPVPAATPEGFAAPAYDDREWDAVAVPANWQMQGYDIPYYTDNQLPFPPDDLPHVPAGDNPTGLYRHRFDIPESWAGRRIFLTFHGVDSAFHLWINGAPAGFSKDSRLPAEFEVTGLIQPGENLLAARVYRWSDGTYLENQDMWRLSGIYRDVELWSAPPLHIGDVTVRTDFPDSFSSARLHVELLVCNHHVGAVSSRRIQVQLFDERGVLAAPVGNVDATLDAGSQATLTWAGTVDAPRLWSDETPDLYTLVLAVDAGSGAPEYVRQRVGFRQVNIVDGRLCINGAPTLVKGVNRHEHDPAQGHTVDEASMCRDIELMKRFNLNAVRTSHYPNHPRWYDLCDEYGIYVLDEANVECDGALEQLAGDPAWEAAFLCRVQRMVARDKNHACIIAWSLGNESGLGANHYAAAAWLRRHDPTRPIHYHPAGDDPITDIIAPMYPSVDQLAAVAERPDTRPVIMCEYAHSMGNGTGNLAEYWAAVDTHARLQGGFVWDWVDQGFRRVTPEGKIWWAYGGDFGDEPNDGNFCLNGLVAPDRTPHPALWEYKKLLEPVRVEAVNLAQGQLRVHNRYHRCSLAHLELDWRLEVDGLPCQAGTLPPLATLPGKHDEIRIPFAADRLPDGREFWLTLRFCHAAATPWAPAGHEVAWAQFRVAGPSPEPCTAVQVAGGVVAAGDDSGSLVQLAAGNITATFDRHTGQLTSYRLGERDLLVRGPVLHFWRAPTDNDEGLWGLDKMAIRWRDAGLDRLVRETRRVDVAHCAGDVQVHVAERWAPDRTGAPLRSGRWDFMLYLLRLTLSQFVPLERLHTLATELAVTIGAPDEAGKFAQVRALVDAADAAGRTPALLAALHRELQRQAHPHARVSFTRRMGEFLAISPEELHDAYTLDYAGHFDAELSYTLAPDGALHLAGIVTPVGPLPDLPRIGLELAVPAAFDRFTWFGRGPHESYPDRKAGAAIGRFTGSVDAQFVPYGRPQENGNKTEVRWGMLADAGGFGLAVAGDEHLNMSVHRYTAADLAAAGHLHDLHPRPAITWNVDICMSGLGNESCGPGVLPAYRIPPVPVSFRITLWPLPGEG
jgi:beta-galactosidase/beta-glucuronidase